MDALPLVLVAIVAVAAADQMLLTDFNGIVEENGNLHKLSSFSEGWNAMVASQASIKGTSDSTRGVSFKVDRVNKNKFMCGLSLGDRREFAEDHSHKYIDFAACCISDNFEVYEMGNYQGRFGKVASGSIVQVLLNMENKVEYRVDGQVRYTSRRVPQFPLFMKTSAHNVGPFLRQIEWISPNNTRFGSARPTANQCQYALEELAEEKLECEKNVWFLEARNAKLRAENEALRSQLRDSQDDTNEL